MLSLPLIKNFQDSSDKLVQLFKKDIASFRSSRPVPALVEDLKVECYGGKSSLKDIASISIQLPNVIIIEPWDQSLQGAISKAISSSSLSLTPNINGNQIKLFLPPLSKERKEELVKLIKEKKEEYRIELKKQREEVIESIKDSFQKKEITEDDKFRFLEDIQKVIDQTNAQLNDVEEKKIKEILEG